MTGDWKPRAFDCQLKIQNRVRELLRKHWHGATAGGYTGQSKWRALEMEKEKVKGKTKKLCGSDSHPLGSINKLGRRSFIRAGKLRCASTAHQPGSGFPSSRRVTVCNRGIEIPARRSPRGRAARNLQRGQTRRSRCAYHAGLSIIRPSLPPQPACFFSIFFRVVYPT